MMRNLFCLLVLVFIIGCGLEQATEPAVPVPEFAAKKNLELHKKEFEDYRAFQNKNWKAAEGKSAEHERRIEQLEEGAIKTNNIIFGVVSPPAASTIAATTPTVTASVVTGAPVVAATPSAAPSVSPTPSPRYAWTTAGEMVAVLNEEVVALRGQQKAFHAGEGWNNLEEEHPFTIMAKAVTEYAAVIKTIGQGVEKNRQTIAEMSRQVKGLTSHMEDIKLRNEAIDQKEALATVSKDPTTSRIQADTRTTRAGSAAIQRQGPTTAPVIYPWCR